MSKMLGKNQIHFVQPCPLNPGSFEVGSMGEKYVVHDAGILRLVHSKHGLVIHLCPVYYLEDINDGQAYPEWGR